ncbi:hypothetical protein KEJ32_06435 [Candidatus Bathyarchaeota archaeon]|nr:hypothetical protein [Candidatus Bathyarchaeota archaeon]
MAGEKEEKEDVEELREVLSVISKEVPALIKGIIASVFSEEAGRDMGRAAAAFYKELKEAGMPEDVAVKMTEGYISTFTSLGEIMKRAVGKQKSIEDERIGKEISKEVSKKVMEKLSEKLSKEISEETAKEIEKELAKQRREKSEEEEEDED